MLRHASVLVLTALLCSAVVAQPRLLGTSANNVVATWHDIAVTTATSHSAVSATPEEKLTIVFADMATVTIAMYDAASAVDGRYQHFGPPPRSNASGASIEAAVSRAAVGVLRGLFPSRAAHYQDAYDSYLKALPAGAQRDAGVALGAEVAAATLALRARDGRALPVAPYVPGSTPGAFRGDKAVFMYAPMMRPFTLTRIDQFRPGPPPALSSAAYAADLNETKALGGQDSRVRSKAQSALALFNTEGPVSSLTRNWGRFARSTSDPADAARNLAATYVVYADTLLACFDAKYHYKAWRPHTAIALADQDDNPATVADPAWRSSQFTPYHPEYPAAHSCVAGGLAGVLRQLHGAQVSFMLDSTVTGTATVFPDTDSYLREAAESRIAGGMHFRFSTVAGQTLGAQVAEQAMRRYFGRRP
jgi:hypothetical protein